MSVPLVRKPATSSNNGELDSSAAQTIAGAKTFTGAITPTGGIVGNSTGTIPSAGLIGEIKENHRSTNTANLVTLQWTSVDSGNTTLNDGNETGITLTPGIWLVQGTVYFTPLVSAALSFLELGIGTAKGNSSTGVVTTQNATFLQLTFTTGAADNCLSTPVWYVNVTTNTTYYLKAYSAFTGGNVVAKGHLKGVRIA